MTFIDWAPRIQRSHWDFLLDCIKILNELGFLFNGFNKKYAEDDDVNDHSFNHERRGEETKFSRIKCTKM